MFSHDVAHDEYVVFSLTSGLFTHVWVVYSRLGCLLTSGLFTHVWVVYSRLGCSLTSGLFTHVWVVHSRLGCLSAFCLSLTSCSCCLGEPGGHMLGKSCPFGFPFVLFNYMPS